MCDGGVPRSRALNGTFVEEFEVRALHDAIWASARAKAFAQRAGLPSRACSELALVTSELVTNVAKYAGRGVVALRVVDEPDPAVELVVTDGGPGMERPDLALLDGFSEGRMLGLDDIPVRRSLGSGLSAVQRLSDALKIECPPAGGTRIWVLKKRKR